MIEAKEETGPSGLEAGTSEHFPNEVIESLREENILLECAITALQPFDGPSGEVLSWMDAHRDFYRGC